MVLYEDRVYSWEQMQSIDKVIDEETQKAGQMVTLSIRNRLAFDELEHYQKEKTFLYKHPLLQEYKQRNELDALRISNPEIFMNDLINASKSITRYESKITNNKYKDKQELQAWKDLIKGYQAKLTIMQALISQ